MKLSQRRIWFLGTKTAASVAPKDPIRLSIITQFFPPDYAPTGQLIDELARLLSNQGMSVDVFTGQPGYAFQETTAPMNECVDKVNVRRSRTVRFWSRRIRGKTINGILFVLRALFHLFHIRQSHILLLTTAPPFLPLLGYFAKVWFKQRYICLLYDLYPDIAVQLGVIPEQHWVAKLWRRINKQVWRQAEAIIVLSSSMKDRVINHCPELADKVYVIHSWADPSWIVPLEKEANWFAQKHDLVDQFTVLYSGNMGRCHDLDTIMAAIEELRDEPIKFVFIGDGGRRQFCLDYVQQQNLTNVLFLPYQDKQILPYSLTACDLTLVSVDSKMEGLVAPSKLYSALASGRPIAAICDNRSYLSTLIKQAQCGATFENGNGVGLASFIRLLRGDRQLAEQMGQSGRHYLQTHFTPPIISRQYFDLMRQAVSVTRR
ncbi:glycosyltransferase family 4 protein [Oscillatoria sp. FACHB-1407]|uniref:glycosyltransferase family 4 protein n=1 Tax=Oscillatoria sp. FACHB-1407 TaxID=2692847 RepID=UPI0016853BE2|nr:glycosyltransferase family 4 protein [Oscillatoria sp. FACHB-1407]MBD2459657.1 glycosyltransferase family 4 protein [Oscillatoria sp. FACHB-1407]